MKTKKLASALISVALILLISVMFAACGTTDIPEPIAVETANTAINLDLYGSGNSTKQITISDYINENGATDVTYSVKSSASCVEVSSIEAGKFTITGKSEDSANVTLTAKQGDKTKVTVTLKVTVADTTPKATVSGIENGTGYTMEGQSSVALGESYSFTLTRAYGYLGTPVISCTMNGAVKALTQTVSGAKYTYVIDSVTGDIVISAVTGLTLDTLDPTYTPALTNAFFDVTGWNNNSCASSWDDKTGISDSGTLVADGDGIQFKSTRKLFGTSTESGLILNDSGAWPNADGSQVGPYQYSFNVKTDGPFKMSFISSAAASPNELRIIFDGTTFRLLRSVGGSTVNPAPNNGSDVWKGYGIAAATDYDFELNKEHRFDLVISAVKQKVTADTVTDLAEGDIVNGLMKIEFYIDGKLVVFVNAAGNTTVYNTSDPSHTYALVDGVTYIQRLNGANAARFNNSFGFNTISGTDGVEGTNLSVYPAKTIN